MKFIWEPEDFDSGQRYAAHGMIVARTGTDECWIIGYHNGTGKKPALVSLTDGLVQGAETPESMSALLNDGGYMPLFAPHRANINVKDRYAIEPLRARKSA